MYVFLNIIHCINTRVRCFHGFPCGNDVITQSAVLHGDPTALLDRAFISGERGIQSVFAPLSKNGDGIIDGPFSFSDPEIQVLCEKRGIVGVFGVHDFNFGPGVRERTCRLESLWVRVNCQFPSAVGDEIDNGVVDGVSYLHPELVRPRLFSDFDEGNKCGTCVFEGLDRSRILDGVHGVFVVVLRVVEIPKRHGVHFVYSSGIIASSIRHLCVDRSSTVPGSSVGRAHDCYRAGK